jgi:WD40 repeat protein
MKKIVLFILPLLFFFSGFSLSQDLKKPFKQKGIEIGLKQKQPEETINEEEDKLFSITPFKTIPQDTTVYRVSLSKEGNYLAFSTKKGKIGIYNLRKGQLIKEEKVSEKPIYYVRFHPFQDIITYGGKDEKIIIYDVEKDTKIHTIIELESPISDAIFTPDGTVLCVAHLGTYGLTFYDTQNYEQLMNIKSPEGGIYYLSVSSDSNFLAYACRDKKISIIPLGEKIPSSVLKKHTFLALCVEFSPDNKFLASGGADTQLFLWKKEKDKIKPYPLFSWVHGDWVTSLKFFKDYLFTASKDGKIRIFDFINKKLLGVFEAADSAVFSLDIDKEGKFLAIASQKDGVKVYELKKILEKIKL